MGFLGEMRKLLFGVKSVSKSAGRKVVEKSEDIADDILDRSADFFDDAKEMASDAGESIKESYDAIKEKVTGAGRQGGSSINRTANKVAESAKNMGEKIAESPIVEKAADISEKVGAKVIDVGGDLMEKGKDISEKVGEKVLKAKDKLVERAKEITEDLGHKLDETIKKAEKMEAEEKANPRSEFADTPLDASGSLLDGKDDFFSKAAAYADGHHGVFSEGKIEIKKDGTKTPEVKQIKAAGFEDLDGDGDEIADDAIIIPDDEVEETTQLLEAPELTVENEEIIKEISEEKTNSKDIADIADQGDSDAPKA